MIDVQESHQQAHIAVHTYLAQAKRVIDEEFGEGYAKANPTLVAAFIQAATSYTNAVLVASTLETQLQEIAEALK